MKILLSLGLSVLILAGCQKKKPENMIREETLQVNLGKTETYQLNLSTFGDADDVSEIVTQARIYTTSEINHTAGTCGFNDVYTYVPGTNPKANEAYTDEVVLKVSEPKRGRHCSGDATRITIHFTISN